MHIIYLCHWSMLFSRIYQDEFCDNMHETKNFATYCVCSHVYWNSRFGIHQLLHVHARFAYTLLYMHTHANNTIAFACKTSFLQYIARISHANRRKRRILRDLACFVKVIASLHLDAGNSDVHVTAWTIIRRLHASNTYLRRNLRAHARNMEQLKT